MEYRRIGNSGLKVSVISLGTWLNFGERIDAATSESIVHHAVAGGINHFDTADGYANGEAERTLGRAIEQVERSQVVLSSKVCLPVGDGPNDRGLSRKHILESVDRTLDNLRTNYLDIYYCHRMDDATTLEETIRAMHNLIQRGKVMYWGTSMWHRRALKRAHRIAKKQGWHHPIVEQAPYNLLERWIERSLLPTTRRLKMGVAAWSPLAGGVLTGKYSNEIPAGSRGASTDWLKGKLNQTTLGRVEEFCKVAKSLELQPAQLALAWILRRPGVATVVTGASDPQQLTSNLAAATIRLSQQTVHNLESLFKA